MLLKFIETKWKKEENVFRETWSFNHDHVAEVLRLRDLKWFNVLEDLPSVRSNYFCQRLTMCKVTALSTPSSLVLWCWWLIRLDDRDLGYFWSHSSFVRMVFTLFGKGFDWSSTDSWLILRLWSSGPFQLPLVKISLIFCRFLTVP